MSIEYQILWLTCHRYRFGEQWAKATFLEIFSSVTKRETCRQWLSGNHAIILRLNSNAWNEVHSEKYTNGNLLDYGMFSRKLTNITDFPKINFSLIAVSQIGRDEPALLQFQSASADYRHLHKYRKYRHVVSEQNLKSYE